MIDKTMVKPLVTVLTVTRNRGDLLRRCITSVLSQTYTNIEHIVVDGASTDNTDEVISEFNDDRLKYYKLDYNWPSAETQDFAISKCNGKYITFLDDDDEYLPSKVEKEVCLIESLTEDYGLVYCWMTYYDTKTNERIKTHSPQLKGDVSDEVVASPVISGTPTLMFRTDLFKQLGGWKSPDEIGLASDWELCARACQFCKVDFVPESLVKVYINHGRVRQSEDRSYYKNIYNRQIKFYNHFLTFFAENFKRHPKLAVNHYYALAVSYKGLNNYTESIKYMFKALVSNPKVVLSKLLKKHDK